MKIWFNGKIVDEKDANVSLKTHALNYGTAVFEGIRYYNTNNGKAIFKLKEHIERLFRSAEALGMNVPFSRKQIEEAIKEVVKSNNLADGYVRPLIFYGDESISVYPKDVSVNCAVIIDSWKRGKEGLRVKVSNFKKIDENSTIPGVKISGNYVNSILAMEDVRKHGFDEALMLDHNGLVSEGPLHNFFIVKDNLIITPISKSSLLGITRETLLTIAKDLGYESIEKDVTVEEVTDADEAFFCGTAVGVVWVKEVDQILISEDIGNITSKIKEKYFDIVLGKDDKYKEWITLIE